ncbi:MAG: SCO family protein [Acidobacteria bacterium]|nr:MAG: SCO family protein [Acidobacteriota bacterium]
MKNKIRIIKFVLILVLSLRGLGFASDDRKPAPLSLPKPLQDVRIDQRLNEQIPLQLEFRDETNRVVHLQDYFSKRPVILTLAYFRCPMLCSYVLRGVAGSLKAVPLTMAKDFDVLTVSFDPNDTPQLALANKNEYQKLYSHPGAAEGWHFLTGKPESIRQLTEAVGFHYSTVPDQGQYAHAATIMILTPEGKLSRYFFGVDFPPKDLRLALIEASQNRVMSISNSVLLFCFHYNPDTGRYSLAIIRILQVFAIVTLTILLGFILTHTRKEKTHA